MPQFWASSGPHPECSVDVDPSAGLTGGVADGAEGVDSAGVHVASLRTHYGRSRGLHEGIIQRIHPHRSEEHTSELQSRQYLVCRLLLEKKQHCALTGPKY